MYIGKRIHATVQIVMGTHHRHENADASVTSTTVCRQMKFLQCTVRGAIQQMLRGHLDEHGPEAKVQEALCVLDRRTGMWVPHSVASLIEEEKHITDDRFGGTDDIVQILWQDNCGKVQYSFGAARPGAARECAALVGVRDIKHEFPCVRIELATSCLLGRFEKPAKFVHVVKSYNTTISNAMYSFCVNQGTGFDIADYNVKYKDAGWQYVDLLGAEHTDCQQFCTSGVCCLRIVRSAESIFCARFGDGPSEPNVSVCR